jgi:hypothetical protein
LLYLTVPTPDSGSTAVSVKVTEVEVVNASPLFITMEPVGGVVSFAALTSATSAPRNTAEDNNSNRAKADTATALLIILSPPSN